MKKGALLLFGVVFLILLIALPSFGKNLPRKIDPKQIVALPAGADQPPLYAIPGGADQPPIFVIPGDDEQPPQFGLDNIPIKLEIIKTNHLINPEGTEPKKSITELFCKVIDFSVPSIATSSDEVNYINSNREFLFVKSGLSKSDQLLLDKTIAEDEKNSPIVSLKIEGVIRVLNNPIENVYLPMIVILKKLDKFYKD